MVRALTVADYSSYSTLRSLALKTDSTSFWASDEDELPIRESRYNDTVVSLDDFILGYFNAEELVAIGGFKREPQPKLKHKGFLWGIYTHPDYRGKGIGKKLVQSLIERAFNISELTQVNLSTRTDNNAALKLYEQLGFERYGVEKNSSFIDGIYYDEVYMVKSRA